MWQVTDRTETTNFVAEDVEIVHNISQFMKGRNQQNQQRMIYKDLRESHSLLQERTQYFTHGDQCFGHLPAVYQMKMYASHEVTAFFAHFTKHTCTAKCNFVTG